MSKCFSVPLLTPAKGYKIPFLPRLCYSFLVWREKITYTKRKLARQFRLAETKTMIPIVRRLMADNLLSIQDNRLVPLQPLKTQFSFMQEVKTDWRKSIRYINFWMPKYPACPLTLMQVGIYSVLLEGETCKAKIAGRLGVSARTVFRTIQILKDLNAYGVPPDKLNWFYSQSNHGWNGYQSILANSDGEIVRVLDRLETKSPQYFWRADYWDKAAVRAEKAKYPCHKYLNEVTDALLTLQDYRDKGKLIKSLPELVDKAEEKSDKNNSFGLFKWLIIHEAKEIHAKSQD